MTTTQDRNVVRSKKEFKVVGTRPLLNSSTGAHKVTGEAIYGADFYPNEYLHGKVLRSPHGHAKIKSINTSKAEALEGVKAVVTYKDYPTNNPEGTHGMAGLPMKQLRDNSMASDKVLYEGHPIAGVAAVNPHIAEEALSLIEIDYEVLPAVLTAPEALKDGAPILLEDLKTKGDITKQKGQTNLAEHFRHEKGDIEKGFGEADHILEREFNTATVHQGYIEPQNTTAYWDKDGRLFIWLSTQGPFEVRSDTAIAVGIDEAKVRVTPMEIGGGFGGKFPLYHEPVAALLSKKSGKAVKIVMSRQEVLEGTGPTPGSYSKVKIGITNEGKITAGQAYIAFEAGAYPGSPVAAGAQCVFAAYDVPNGLVDGLDVVVNKPKAAAYRAPGATQVAMATETVIDELAEKIGMDPIEIRMINAAKEGTRRIDGPVYPLIGCEEVLKEMKKHPHYNAPITNKNVGRGVAIGFWFNAGLHSSATISVNSDGTVNLVEGSPDIGGSRASLSMMAAEVLGINPEEVNATVTNTDQIGYTFGTGGSRVTFATGWAVYEAAQDAKKQMIARAAKIWDVDASTLELKDGNFQSKTDSALKITFKELASELHDAGEPILGVGNVDPSGEGGAFAGNIVDVEVDPDTGKVKILRFTVIQDAGKAIHPSFVEGQMQGGSVQGIGWALNEEYFYNKSGNMSNVSLLDYRMPTSLDLPNIDTVIVEVANPGHPFGVRGVGEVNIAPPPAAIANAINKAIGVRMNVLPMNPNNIMDAIWNK